MHSFEHSLNDFCAFEQTAFDCSRPEIGRLRCRVEIEVKVLNFVRRYVLHKSSEIGGRVNRRIIAAMKEFGAPPLPSVSKEKAEYTGVSKFQVGYY